jgi:hypothetical protein
MYLFLGEADDALGRDVRQTLEERGAQVRVLPDPFSQRFSWRLDSIQTSSVVTFEDGTDLVDSDISGLLLRRSKTPQTNRVSADDDSYIETEIEAAILGWIWSLPCPVINRLPAWLWYCPNLPLQFWGPLLQANGLQGIDLGKLERNTGATNTKESEAFGIGDLSIAYGWACVVGHKVIWDRARPNFDRCETALIELTRCAGLSFLEIAVAKTSDGFGVNEVNPFPDLTRFCPSSRCAVTETLATLFTGSNHPQ